MLPHAAVPREHWLGALLKGTTAMDAEGRKNMAHSPHTHFPAGKSNWPVYQTSDLSVQKLLLYPIGHGCPWKAKLKA